MTVIKYLVFVFAVCILAGCDVKVNVGAGNNGGLKGSGVEATETRNVGEFDSVSLKGYGDLNLSQGDESSVTITTDDNILEIIETEVKDGELVISLSEAINLQSGMAIDIVSPNLKVIELAGAANVKVNDLSVDSLSFKVSGAGKVGGTGNVNDLTVEINGAGTASLEKLESLNTKVAISGAGTATVHAKESIDATISGVGSIKVHGNPPNQKKSTSGLGRIEILK